MIKRLSRRWTVLPATAIAFAAVAAAVPARAAASQHPYRLVDPGTFGGPQSFLNLPAVPLTPDGALLGTADTATRDADYPRCNPFMVGPDRYLVGPDRYLVHAFEWRGGRHRGVEAATGPLLAAARSVNTSWPSTIGTVGRTSQEITPSRKVASTSPGHRVRGRNKEGQAGHSHERGKA
jgi:hypothetical protein